MGATFPGVGRPDRWSEAAERRWQGWRRAWRGEREGEGFGW